MKDVFENIEEDIDLKLDKSKWKHFKFSELAKNITEKITPKDSSLTHYIGLEHLDSGSLRIRRFGDPKSLDGDKLRIYKGDIIFAKRNAYLKRAAIAEFDAVASAHSMVLRAIPENVLPEFFPFFLLSDVFWNRAIEISVGSLSPTINWKALAKQEFLLPPKDQQARLAELLWAADKVIERNLVLSQLGDDFLKAQTNKLTLSGFDKKIIRDDKVKVDIGEKWIVFKIKELVSNGSILEIQDGNHGELHPKSSDYVSDGIPFIMANTIVDGELDLNNASKLPKKLTDKLRIGFSRSGDVLLTHKGTIGQVAIVPDSINHEYLMLTPQVTYYRLNPKLLSNRFLFFVFNAEYFQKQLVAQSSQSTRAYIGITAQTSLNIALPRTIQEQEQIANILETTTKSIKKLENHIELSRQLQKSLINQIF